MSGIWKKSWVAALLLTAAAASVGEAATALPGNGAASPQMSEAATALSGNGAASPQTSEAAALPPGVLSWAAPAAGAAPYASAALPTAAAAETAVTLSYPNGAIALPQNARLPIADKLVSSAKVALRYASGNPAIAKVNGAGVLLPVAAGKTKVTIDVESPGYAGRLVVPVTVTAAKPAARDFQPKPVQRKVSAGGKTFTVTTVTVPKGTPVTTGIAGNRVGSTQPLAGIAAGYRAEAAVNGTFFDAYSGIPDPYGNLIASGQPVHIGNLGTTIGFKWDGSAVMDSLRISVSGEVEGADGRPKSWYAYFLNRRPTSGTTATLFTPDRGPNLGFAAGTAVTVRSGKVTRIAAGENASIPKDGYVIVFMGAESGQASRFRVGAKAGYRFEYKNAAGEPLDWSAVHTAIGAGPRLIKDGKIALDAAAEGFRDAKILTGGGARSGIAILPDGSTMLAAVSGATMKQWAQIFEKLGVKQAMNLDGGASSGLWAAGRTVVSPGRELSNALLFGDSLKW